MPDHGSLAFEFTGGESVAVGAGSALSSDATLPFDGDLILAQADADSDGFGGVTSQQVEEALMQAIGEADAEAKADAAQAYVAKRSDYKYVEHPPEPPHFIQVWFLNYKKALKSEGKSEYEAYGKVGEKQNLVQTLHVGPLDKKLPLFNYAPWENHVFFGIGAIVLIVLFFVMTASFRRNREEAMRRPGRLQILIEMIVGGFDSFCKGILGEENGRKYMPFIGTMFCLILVLNLMGLIPLMRASTSALIITLSLALTTFLFTQYTAWVKLGPASYIHHLMGQPNSAVQWALSPLLLVLELISDFLAKPLSLALRLMGNILGKDILMGSFLFMGIALVAAVSPGAAGYVGVPLTVPFYFLGLLLSTIQALVFALLSAIYIMMVLPHDHEHGHDDGHGHEVAGAH